MFIRFVVRKRGEESGSRLGIVHAADELLEDGDLEEHEERVIKSAFAWFNRKLPVPTGVSSPGQSRAISWFRDSAEESIEQMWSIVAILREHGVSVDVVTTTNPGRIVYQDEWQVFAVPFKDRNASA